MTMHPVRLLPFAILLSALAILPAAAQTSFTVTARQVTDEKAVFATVESANVVAARARIGGTVVSLVVKDGEQVTQGQVIALVADDKLVLQLRALDAQIAGLTSQVAQATTDLSRAERLFHLGAGPRATYDAARTALSVAQSALRARVADRATTAQQLAEGRVHAPVTGRVLTTPITVGTVILPGEPVATIAQLPYILRLRVPERHAAFMKVGDPVRVDGRPFGSATPIRGIIRLVYPQIQNGRVVADAAVTDLHDYFVARRVLVWISAGTRTAFVVPEHFIINRSGLDEVDLRTAKGVFAIPVQRGEPRPSRAIPDGIELLSGVSAGDVLVAPPAGAPR